MASSDQFTVGIDFGTLSGRAVVVARVRRRRGGQRRARLRPWGHGRPPPPRATCRCLRTGRSRCRGTTSTCSRDAVPEAVRAGRDRPRPGDRDRDGLHRLHGAAGPRGRDAAVRAARLRRAAARLRQALEAPRGAAAGRPDQRARAPAGRVLDRPLRRPDLERVGVRQGAPAAGGGPRALRPRGPLGRGGGLDHLAADAVRYVRNACTAGYKGIFQDGALPRRRLPGGAEPGLRRLRGGASSTARSASSATRPDGSPPTRRPGPGCPRASPVAVGNVDAHVTAPAAQAVEPGQMVAIMGTSTCHVMSSRRAARGARHVRGRRRRHRGRQLGLRGRPERGGRHLRMVHATPPCRRRTPRRRRPRASRCTSTSPGSPPSRVSASTAWSPWTGTAGTGRCWSTTSSAAWSSDSRWPPGRRTSTGRCWRRRRSARG